MSDAPAPVFPAASVEPLLEVAGLTVEFSTDEGVIRAADEVSFSLEEGQVLGLVGESGCGKTVSAMSVPRLIPQPPGRIVSGRIRLGGRDLLSLPVEAMRQVRGREIGVIFQEPMTALSPLHRVERQLGEVALLHTAMSRRERRDLALHWLERVGIGDPLRCLNAYPHELSGGMRQRVMIAMAMLLQPRLVIADEPTTALDVTIQAQILELMRGIRAKNAGLLLITHDMGVIWEMCDQVAVMYAGRVVESAPVARLFAAPLHPYTQGLLESIPALQPAGRRLRHIPGQVPSLLHPPPGCQFADRCPKVSAVCRQEVPLLREASAGHRVACWNC